MGNTLRTETHNGVHSIVLTRAAEYNTITPELRDELGAAIDEEDSDRVILLRAESDAFCACYRLATSTQAQIAERSRQRGVGLDRELPHDFTAKGRLTSDRLSRETQKFFLIPHTP